MEEPDFFKMRKMMVDCQLVTRGISEARVLAAFLKVPRHKFISDEYVESAYSDYPVPIGSSQTISQPFMSALMSEKLNPDKTTNVLEIGTGSGYQTAILAELSLSVYSVERIESLAVGARKTLSELGYTNISIVSNDGTLGWREHAPYDRILVTAGAPKIPESLVMQLRDGGRMVIPVGNSLGQVLTIIEKIGSSVTTTQVCGCVFVPLVGKEGWAK